MKSHRLARWLLAQPDATVFVEALPESNEWTHIARTETVTREPTVDHDLVTTNNQRIHKGSILLATRGPAPEILE